MLEGELEKAFPASMVESVKASLQRTAGVNCTTDGEGGSTEKKGALTKRSPPKKGEDQDVLS